jgi:hypothetical protein
MKLPTIYELVQAFNPQGLRTTAKDGAPIQDRGVDFYYNACTYLMPPTDDVHVLWSSSIDPHDVSSAYAFAVLSGRIGNPPRDQRDDVIVVRCIAQRR